jgi:hypothetical protein
MKIKYKISKLESLVEKTLKELKELKDLIPVRFEPESNEKFWFVDADGKQVRRPWVKLNNDIGLFINYNMFKNQIVASIASKMMTRNNAIIMACLLVDPTFVPNYTSGNQKHYSFEYFHPQMGHNGEWIFQMSFSNDKGPCVSTEEKWEEAVEFLNEWKIT